MLETASKNNFESIWSVMDKSFPNSEHRTYENQRKLLDNEKYKIYVYRENDKIIGFIALWEFDSLTFIEHFAVDADYRNNGTGSKIINEIIRLKGSMPVYLEAEPPQDEMTKRRINFYQRNGFKLNEYTFIQPPLMENQPSVPLKIMTYPEKVSDEEYKKYCDIIFRYVYNGGENYEK